MQGCHPGRGGLPPSPRPAPSEKAHGTRPGRCAHALFIALRPWRLHPPRCPREERGSEQHFPAPRLQRAKRPAEEKDARTCGPWARGARPEGHGLRPRRGQARRPPPGGTASSPNARAPHSAPETFTRSVHEITPEGRPGGGARSPRPRPAPGGISCWGPRPPGTGRVTEVKGGAHPPLHSAQWAWARPRGWVLRPSACARTPRARGPPQMEGGVPPSPQSAARFQEPRGLGEVPHPGLTALRPPRVRGVEGGEGGARARRGAGAQKPCSSGT